MWFRATDPSPSVPILFLAVIILVAVCSGTIAGIMGTCAASAIFAYFLFPPIASLNIFDVHQRSNLGWLLVAGVAISFLLGVPPAERTRSRF